MLIEAGFHGTVRVAGGRPAAMCLAKEARQHSVGMLHPTGNISPVQLDRLPAEQVGARLLAKPTQSSLFLVKPTAYQFVMG
jgi:hypothetical protein